ncbi:Iron-containing alcohol dehydrogenase [gamma proteobacterium HdN1]|nr:Iron-containing alcohol dehydrogenase [gamma proteobacterium HdN1]
MTRGQHTQDGGHAQNFVGPNPSGTRARVSERGIFLQCKERHMNAITQAVPFPLQTVFYRGLTQSLKHVGKVIGLFVRPPEMFTGPGASLLLGDAIAGSGVKRLLIVTDAQLAKLGLVQPLQDHLTELGVFVAVYDGVLPDPGVEQIEEGLRVLQQERCEAVLAIGGGSAMDCAKLIATRATNPSKSVLEMAGFFKVPTAPLPIYCVPTTAGTGSEVSVGAVVSDPAQQRKLPVIDHKLVPAMAALDGQLMLGLPPAITAATAMDALTHAVEAYISRIATPESDRYALEAVSLIMRHLPRVMKDGRDLNSRQLMAWAAYRAGLALSRGGLGYVHGIAHNFGALYHTPHGWANAIVLPYVLEYSKSDCIPRLAELARASGLASGTESDAELADKFIQRIHTLKQECGIPAGLADLRAEDIPQIAAAALQEAHFTYAVPRYMDQKTCEGLVRRMLVRASSGVR